MFKARPLLAALAVAVLVAGTGQPSAGENLPRSVSAGQDQTIGPFDTADLDGTVMDGGLPARPGKITTIRRQMGASGSIIRVPRDRPTIQAGIDAARDRDLVLVSPGVYKENLSLSGKTITLASEFFADRDPNTIGQTIIDGGGGNVITVDASVGPDTQIIGFTIQGGEDGISAAGKLQITDNRFIDNRDGIDYEGGGGICRNNFFAHNRDDAVDLDWATEVIIEDNIIRDSRDDGIEIRLQPYAGPTLNIVIRGNVIAGNGRDGIQLIGYGTEAQPKRSNRFFLIERNLLHGNGKAGLGMMDKAETVEDFRAASLPERVHVFNNTFANNDHGIAGGDNLIALNNLFVNSASLAVKALDGGSIAAHNLFWNNRIDHQGSNLDRNTNLFADPAIDPDFRLRPGSPAIDAGTNFFERHGETILDLSGNAFLGTAPDLGAFESGCGVPDVPPRLAMPAPGNGPGLTTERSVTVSGTAHSCGNGDL